MFTEKLAPSDLPYLQKNLSLSKHNLIYLLNRSLNVPHRRNPSEGVTLVRANPTLSVKLSLISGLFFVHEIHANNITSENMMYSDKYNLSHIDCCISCSLKDIVLT